MTVTCWGQQERVGDDPATPDWVLVGLQSPLGAGENSSSLQGAVLSVVFILCLGAGEVKAASLSAGAVAEVCCRMLSILSFSSLLLPLPRLFQLIWQQRSKDFWIWQLLWGAEACRDLQLWWWQCGLSRLWLLQPKQSRYYVNPSPALVCQVLSAATQGSAACTRDRYSQWSKS